MSFAFFSYLSNSSSSSLLQIELDSLRRQLHQLVKSNEYNSNEKINNIITGDEKQFILRKIQHDIETGFTKEYFNQIKNDIIKNNSDEYLQYSIKSSINRLSSENDRLNKQGNVNLFIGLVLSIIGLMVLGVAIHSSPVSKDLTDLFINIFPRTIFVLLIELFSYFFLNLYKKSLDEIKYYQNEITNLEAKYLSLNIAQSTKNHKLISEILNELVKTERNFILEKDQSTIELEKERLHSNTSNNTLEVIKDIFKNKT
ncbi:hypothetical protein E0H80_10490 [Acinetobacter sp. ANC 4779]|uniref:hypothetical protein n=1 Tax=Acinetobacter sp. ANC 4779 TaxID=2529848 RepID=UPI00103B0B8B|nr:hypothetical protein [Acinetobacter sp. ANC 4779]TCB49834.1 hypothetical protein E0H80_10490 [Acinetobacter sp. ANC 4779]